MKISLDLHGCTGQFMLATGCSSRKPAVFSGYRKMAIFGLEPLILIIILMRIR